MRRLKVVAGGLTVVTLAVAGVWLSVRAAYGAFEDAYYVTVHFPRAGMGLKIGSDVRTKGVEIGEVAKVELVDHHAAVQLKILSDYRVPKDARARVELKTPLGAKYVDLEFPPGANGPYLENGDVIADGYVGPELEDLLDDGTRLLAAIDPDDLGTVISELATGVRNRGDDINRGLVANADLASLFAATTDPQIRSLEDFDVLFEALDDKGGDLNALADATNEGVPVYASERAQRALARALDKLVPFSDDLSDILILQRRDIARMAEGGDKVLGTIAARSEGLEDLVHGLYRYVYKLGQPIGDFFMLEDGSAGAGFTNFIGGNDRQEETNQICTAFPPELRDQIPACEDTTP